MRPPAFPPSFVLERTALTWHEAVWGYTRGWIDWRTLSEVAVRRLVESADNRPEEIELAAMTNAGQSVDAGDLAQRLADAEPAPNHDRVARKWLYLVLAWVYDNRAHLSDPLGMVEEIYADFEYPEVVSPFVRFMPATDGYDPLRHSPEENETRMYAHWRSYLAEAAREFRQGADR